MSNLNQKLIFCLLLLVLNIATVSAQDLLPTGDISHTSIDFPFTPVISTQIENVDEPTYYQVEFNSQEVLDTYYYDSISTTPPDYETQMRYFWTFGDGHISYESNPVHQYVAGGSYEVTLQATPIYTPKPPPPLMKIEVDVPEGVNGVLDVSSSLDFLSPAEIPDRLFLKAEMLRSFRSNFESSMIITYKSDQFGITNDAIQIYYNSEKVDAVAVYSFQGETLTSVDDIESSWNLGEELNLADKMLTIPFTNLEQNETRRILVQFVSNNSLVTFDPSINFGLNFQNEVMEEIALIETSLRKSWDPNAKEAFVNFISPDDIPSTIKYRIFMENIGSAPADMITVLDRVHPVLNIDEYASHAIVNSKDDEVTWTYEPNIEDHNVNYFSSNIDLPGQTPETNIEDSKFWFDVEYELDNPTLEERITISNGHCRNGVYRFGEFAKITFDYNPAINTNTPYIEAGCPKEEISHCIEIKDIFPNPVFNVAQLTYKLEASLQKPLDVFALSKFGKMIPIASNLSAQKGTHTYNLDFSHLKADVYRLILRNKHCSAKVEGFVKK